MKKVSMPVGRSIGYKPEHPERTARKAGKGYDGLITFQTWNSREAMARSIRMQQSRAPKPDDWKAVVPLKEWEGF